MVRWMRVLANLRHVVHVCERRARRDLLAHAVEFAERVAVLGVRLGLDFGLGLLIDTQSDENIKFVCCDAANSYRHYHSDEIEH